MSANPTPDDDEVLRALAVEMANGCHLHEVAIGIKQNTEAAMLASIAQFDTARQAFDAADLAVSVAYDTVQAADAAGELVLKNCRLRFVNLFGGSYSPAWGSVGWPGESTALPDAQDTRFTLLASLKAYFTATPASESADLGATAAACTTAYNTLNTARTGVNTAKAARTTARDAQKAASKELRGAVRGLINELGQRLEDDSSLYEAFGLNIPSDPSAPEPITTLTLSAIGGGKILAGWNYATRSTGTRLRVKRVGIDEDFVTLGSYPGLEHSLTGYTAGQQVQMVAIAYNDGGEAAPSPVASVVIS